MRRCLAARVGRIVGRDTPFLGAAFGALALVVLGGEQRLAAQGLPGDDPDGDFLCTAQEQVLGTAADVADTDHDGFSDLEELARGTAPTYATQYPVDAMPVHLGMTAHAGADDRIHVLVALHSVSTNPRAPQMRFGVQIDNRLVLFSNAWVAANSTSRLTTGAGGQGLLHLYDIAIDPAVILGVGHLTFFSTVTLPGSPSVISADAVRFASVDGVVVLVISPPRPGPMQSVPAPGSIYVPLPTTGGGGIPASWSAGSVCFQRSAPVAFNGAVVTQEVVSASCIEGWDGYCPPNCAASVGSTFSTVDPVVLIGG